MTMNAWTITKDHDPDPDAKPGTNGNATGLCGPLGVPLTHGQINSHPEAKPFRMYDDDNTLCYEGFLIGDDDFAPLDDFGEPNAGCTRIDVKENGEWATV